MAQPPSPREQSSARRRRQLFVAMALLLIGILTKLGGPILHAYLFEERSGGRHAAHDTASKQPRTSAPALALHLASQSGDAPAAAAALIRSRGRVDINRVHPRLGLTPLHLATVGNHIAVVELLLASAELDVNKAEKGGRTALFMAAEAGNAAVVALLLKTGRGVDVNVAKEGGWTSLHVAAEHNHAAVLRLLLAGTGTGTTTDTPKINVNALATGGITPLIMATANGHAAAVALLTKEGRADVDMAMTQDMHPTPLCIAALGGAADIVALLVSAGADVNKAALNGASPLYIATQAGFVDVATLLVHHASTNIDQATPDGTTPLYVASARGDSAIAALLVNEGRANVNLARTGGWTPLMIAAAENHMGVLGVLAGSGKVGGTHASSSTASPAISALISAFELAVLRRVPAQRETWARHAGLHLDASPREQPVRNHRDGRKQQGAAAPSPPPSAHSTPHPSPPRPPPPSPLRQGTPWGMLNDTDGDIAGYLDRLATACSQQPASAPGWYDTCYGFLRSLVYDPRCTTRLDSGHCAASLRTNAPASTSTSALTVPRSDPLRGLFDYAKSGKRHRGHDVTQQNEGTQNGQPNHGGIAPGENDPTTAATNVVIVGAGPVGLHLASMLAELNRQAVHISSSSSSSSRKRTPHRPYRIAVFENRREFARCKRAYSREWLTELAQLHFAGVVDPRVARIVRALSKPGTSTPATSQPLTAGRATGGPGLLAATPSAAGLPINMIETLLLLSNRDRGVRFVYDDIERYREQLRGVPNLVVFDASGHRVSSPPTKERVAGKNREQPPQPPQLPRLRYPVTKHGDPYTVHYLKVSRVPLTAINALLALQRRIDGPHEACRRNTQTRHRGQHEQGRRRINVAHADADSDITANTTANTNTNANVDAYAGPHPVTSPSVWCGPLFLWSMGSMRDDVAVELARHHPEVNMQTLIVNLTPLQARYFHTMIISRKSEGDGEAAVAGQDIGLSALIRGLRRGSAGVAEGDEIDRSRNVAGWGEGGEGIDGRGGNRDGGRGGRLGNLDSALLEENGLREVFQILQEAPREADRVTVSMFEYDPYMYTTPVVPEVGRGGGGGLLERLFGGGGVIEDEGDEPKEEVVEAGGPRAAASREKEDEGPGEYTYGEGAPPRFAGRVRTGAAGSAPTVLRVGDSLLTGDVNAASGYRTHLHIIREVRARLTGEEIPGVFQ